MFIFFKYKNKTEIHKGHIWTTQSLPRKSVRTHTCYTHRDTHTCYTGSTVITLCVQYGSSRTPKVGSVCPKRSTVEVKKWINVAFQGSFLNLAWTCPCINHCGRSSCPKGRWILTSTQLLDAILAAVFRGYSQALSFLKRFLLLFSG